MQSLGEIELRAPAVGAKTGVFLYVSLGLPARGGHSSNKYCVTINGDGRFWCHFQRFFRKDCSVRCTTWLSVRSPVGATIFAKLPSKLRKVQKSAEKFLENLLPVKLLVRTNLFIPSRLRYVATCGKNLYRCTSTFSALNYFGGIFFISLSYLYEVVRKNFSADF